MNIQDQEPKKKSLGNVFYIGLLSFFGGISQDMFVPIFPLYLANVLGMSKAFIGLAEGLVTSGASLFRIVAGFLIDKFGKKKFFIFLGYFFSMMARPLLAFTSVAGVILGLRFLDGVGKGVKDPPKDALIADSTYASNRGKGFGVARMLDTFGSVVGPLILFALLYLLRAHSFKYHIILMATALPLLFTLLILRVKVKEEPVLVEKKSPNASSLRDGALPRQFYWFMGIVLLFGLSNFPDAFLILRAQNIGITLLAIPLVYAVFNFIYASASVPLGSLSDKIGREKVIVIGWLICVMTYLGFALADAAYQIWILFAFYGMYYATTQSVAKAFVADMVSSEARGRAYGIYNAALGLVALPASFLAGFLWDRIHPSAPFFFSAGLGAAAIILFLIFSQLKIFKSSKLR